MSLNHYPQSPVNVPKELTKLTPSYQFRAFLAIISILLFFALYSSLIIGLGFLVYHAIFYEIFDLNRVTIFLKAGAVAGSVMLFIFTLKFVFKLSNNKPENRVKLDKNEHLILWNFVHQICLETGAPKPKAIYADPDVNAYVSYTNMWLSLIMPVRKELTIGLGLVSCLNLSEFKAVLSHEFGHFAQRSMKIGSYIISANTIIHDMIFSRDKWDEMLDRWRASDIRLSAAAWVITPIIWIIRQILILFYQLLNLMHSSLSREMEFNADKVAISTSGSDAIVSALWKLDGGAENWNNTINNAYLASQKNISVKNLYVHNNLAHERGSEEQKNLLNNLPEDSRGGRKFFSDSEMFNVGMYASHPPNHKREENAKVPFVACLEDENTPWVLFSSIEKLQERLTSLVYDKYLSRKQEEFVDTKEFEYFIKEESKGKKLLEEYSNTFENRYLHIPEKLELEEEGRNIKQPFKEKLASLKLELNKLMEPVKEIDLLMLKAQQISEGAIKEKSFSFQGETYGKKKLSQGFEILFAEREKLFNEAFVKWDTSFCAVNLLLAKSLGKEVELLNLYIQHSVFTKIYKALVKLKNTIFEELNTLQSKDDVTQNQVNSFGDRVNDLLVSFNQEFEKLDKIDFVPLPNIDNLKELKEAITENGCFTKEPGPIFENGGFDKIGNTIETAISHCQRIDQKSIGVILLYLRELQNENQLAE